MQRAACARSAAMHLHNVHSIGARRAFPGLDPIPSFYGRSSRNPTRKCFLLPPWSNTDMTRPTSIRAAHVRSAILQRASARCFREFEPPMVIAVVCRIFSLDRRLFSRNRSKIDMAIVYASKTYQLLFYPR